MGQHTPLVTQSVQHAQHVQFLREQASSCLEECLEYPLVFAIVSGAHQYGFPNAESDLDVRGVYALPTREVAGLIKGPSRIEYMEAPMEAPIDIMLHDVEKYVLLLLAKNGTMLEHVFSPLILHTSPLHQELKRLANACITRYHVKHYSSFAAKEWKKLQQEKYRQEKGVKGLLYLYRVLLTGIHLMQTGRIKTNLSTLGLLYDKSDDQSHIEQLMERRLSGMHEALDKHDLPAAQLGYTQLTNMLEYAFLHTVLPEQVSEKTKQELHQFILRTRSAW